MKTYNKQSKRAKVGKRWEVHLGVCLPTTSAD